MKVIFLDIDGVLNNGDAVERGECHFGWPALLKHDFTQEGCGWDAESVALLRELVEETKAEIVISSTWRGHISEPEDWNTLFAAWGFDSPVIGVTPRNSDGFRGGEVNTWLFENADLSIKGFICIDDEGDFFPGQNLVQTKFNEGFRRGHFEQAKFWLDNC